MMRRRGDVGIVFLFRCLFVSLSQSPLARRVRLPEKESMRCLEGDRSLNPESGIREKSILFSGLLAPEFFFLRD